MKTILTSAAVLALATAVSAAPIKLAPANPQPSGLKQGLAVQYAFPGDVKSLSQAEAALKSAKPGKPLAGLDYRDTNDGDPTLTSGRAHHVVALITGYVKFDEPGIYYVDFVTNDGLQVQLGGKRVAKKDGRFACQETDLTEVEVPQAGWYPIEAVYFQRLGTSCLHMRSGMDEPDWMPNSAFGYK